MQEFQGRTAVITGAASGIGEALARHAAREGMKVVLADIDESALSTVAAELGAAGAMVLPVPTDVSSAEQVEALAERAFREFGGVHLLCNNAGIGHAGPLWEPTLPELEWVIGVNLWGVIHGIRSFVPRLLEQGTEAHIVNTASIAGLVAGGGLYGLTKHAIVSFSESLYWDLRMRQAPVGVSVLCPGFVNTRIVDHSTQQFRRFRGGTPEEPARSHNEAVDAIRKAIAAGMAPQEVAVRVFQAVREEQFYILTHPEFLPYVRYRMEDILGGLTPGATLIQHQPARQSG